jgi:NAD(P)-dependent dehydrogenase (short-subunit alcohol dehydrogenase family)
MRLFEKNALVTGAGRGIGRAIVTHYAREGADIVAVDVDEKILDEVATEVRGLGRKCLTIRANLSKVDEIRSMSARALAEFGHIDVLVNNAAVTKAMGFFEITEEDWNWMFDLNMRGLFFCMQSIGKSMVERKKGNIVNIASIGGKGYPLTTNAGYAASKGGVIALTRIAAQLLGPSNVNVNAICPGATVTEMSKRTAQERAVRAGITVEELLAAREARIPLRRENTPEDVAHMAVYLGSDEARNVTGQAINVDGGMMP